MVKKIKIINENGKRQVIIIKGVYPILNTEGKIQYVTVEGGKLVDDHIKEQINELSQNKYVEFVSKDKITFIKEFKLLFINEFKKDNSYTIQKSSSSN